MSPLPRQSSGRAGLYALWSYVALVDARCVVIGVPLVAFSSPLRRGEVWYYTIDGGGYT